MPLLEWDRWNGLAAGAEEAAVPLSALNFPAVSTVGGGDGFRWGVFGFVVQSCCTLVKLGGKYLIFSSLLRIFYSTNIFPSCPYPT